MPVDPTRHISDPQNAGVIEVTLTGSPIDILSSTAADPQNRCTAASFAVLYGGEPGLRDRGNGNFAVKQAGYIDFVFSDVSIRPIGIAFKYGGEGSLPSVRADSNVPLGKIGLFPDGKHNNIGSTLRIYDSFTDDRKRDRKAIKWSYYIFFQTALGAVGVIDPQLENDADA